MTHNVEESYLLVPTAVTLITQNLEQKDTFYGRNETKNSADYCSV
jgi:hypothetical protein